MGGRGAIREVHLWKYRTGDLSMPLRARIATLSIATAASLGPHGQIARAQQTAPAAAAVAAGPAVNDVAPDFTLTGADRYGLLKTPVRLSDFRGRTVVLAFFYQARTKG
jgi:cytochrome oxidase Cu insertion factor (SCO1/SenC/PrrC family)